MPTYVAAATASVALTLGMWAIAISQSANRLRIDDGVAWHSTGVWLKAETHVHTKFSDGLHAVDEVIGRALANGCDVVAVTDHADRQMTAATAEYHAAIAAARVAHPTLVLVTGLEWNVPPARGDDHAVVLFPTALESVAVTGEFKRRFDDYDRGPLGADGVSGAFAWLRTLATVEGSGPIVFLNHPARKAADTAAVERRLRELLEAGSGIFAGVEGAPGHQKATPLGAYGGAMKPDDRWDSAIAPPGGAWDARLAAGDKVWGALSTADFHAERSGDYWPCQFSATWIHAPDRSVAGVIKALRAGTFVGVHGGIAEQIRLSAMIRGLPRAALAGESIVAPAGARVTLELRATVPGVDWSGQPNRVDEVEFIGIGQDGARSLARLPWPPTGVVTYEVAVPAGSFAIRARGRRIVEEGPDLLFYTNPVFFNRAESPARLGG